MDEPTKYRLMLPMADLVNCPSAATEARARREGWSYELMISRDCAMVYPQTRLWLAGCETRRGERGRGSSTRPEVRSTHLIIDVSPAASILL